MAKKDKGLISTVLVILLLYTSLAPPIYSQNAQIKELANKSHKTRVRAIFDLHKLGKLAIPALINNISDEKEVFFPLNEPRTPQIGTTRCHIGRLSAYTIELILGRDKLIPPQSEQDYDWMLGPHSENYIYPAGIIAKENRELIGTSDLAAVQRIYQDWWEKNKDKSIDVLRNGWTQDNRPLSKSNYHWE